jgi:hypothetical protein
MAKYVAMMAKRMEEMKVMSPDVDDKLCGGWSHRFCVIAFVVLRAGDVTTVRKKKCC